MTADVTIVVVPRERFSRAIESLNSIYRHTDYPFKLVYVDGNSPPAIGARIADASRERGFTLLRRDRYLIPNEARNLGLACVDTEFVVFLDNDVLVTPGWLERLVACARDTSAWLVIPLYLEGRPEDRIVHMAGGTAVLSEEGGRRVFKNAHRFFGRPVDDVKEQLRREPTGSIEYHCLLARRDVFGKVGLFDERIPSVWEHTDLALSVQEQGGRIYFEPEAIVSYDSAGTLKWYDLAYFAVRWSDEWGRMSIDRFREKWGLSPDDRDVKFMYQYSAIYRRHFLRRLLPIQPRLFGRNLGTPAVSMMDQLLRLRFARPARIAALTH